MVLVCSPWIERGSDRGKLIIGLTQTQKMLPKNKESNTNNDGAVPRLHGHTALDSIQRSIIDVINKPALVIRVDNCSRSLLQASKILATTANE
jgi:hypothetical protein